MVDSKISPIQLKLAKLHSPSDLRCLTLFKSTIDDPESISIRNYILVTIQSDLGPPLPIPYSLEYNDIMIYLAFGIKIPTESEELLSWYILLDLWAIPVASREYLYTILDTIKRIKTPKYNKVVTHILSNKIGEYYKDCKNEQYKIDILAVLRSNLKNGCNGAMDFYCIRCKRLNLKEMDIIAFITNGGNRNLLSPALIKTIIAYSPRLFELCAYRELKKINYSTDEEYQDTITSYTHLFLDINSTGKLPFESKLLLSRYLKLGYLYDSLSHNKEIHTNFNNHGDKSCFKSVPRYYGRLPSYISRSLSKTPTVIINIIVAYL